MLLALFLAIASVWGCAKRTTSEAEGRIYVHRVAENESLEDIADDYYGNASRGEVIGAFNSVENEDLHPGMTLRVPMKAEDIENLQRRRRAHVPYNQGLKLAEEGAYLDAVAQFREALSIDPNFVDAYYNLGVTLQKMKAYDRAMVEISTAIRFKQNNPHYHYALGSCLFHMKEYERAAGAFENVMLLDSSHTKALYSLAVAYEKLRETKKARDAWKRYLRLDSDSVWADEARKRLQELR
jgi:tetratricopeptide (TPR) repeat protein